MKVRVEAADKCTAKPEDTIFIGNNQVLVVIDWGERETAEESSEALDRRILDCFKSGNSCRESKDYTHALLWYIKAYKLHKQQKETDPIVEAVLCENIGNCYYMLNVADKSIDYCLTALRLREETQGIDNADVAYVCNFIGMIYYLKEDWSKAMEYVSRAFNIYNNVLGDTHPFTKTALENIEGVTKRINQSKEKE